MSREIVTALSGNFERSHGLYLQFMEQCPDKLWARTFGGWPLWQHVLHTYACIDLFTLQAGGQAVPLPVAEDLIALARVGSESVDKAPALDFMKVMKARADAYIAGLDDSMLAKKNEGFSGRRNMEFSHAQTMSILIGHAFYHFGTLDAALREEGLKGIM